MTPEELTEVFRRLLASCDLAMELALGGSQQQSQVLGLLGQQQPQPACSAPGSPSTSVHTGPSAQQGDGDPESESEEEEEEEEDEEEDVPQGFFGPSHCEDSDESSDDDDDDSSVSPMFRLCVPKA